MFGLLLPLALQAATAQQVALATAADAPPAEQTEAAPPAEPQRKKVCRTVIDNRTGPMAKSRKQCRFVTADEETN